MPNHDSSSGNNCSSVGRRRWLQATAALAIGGSSLSGVGSVSADEGPDHVVDGSIQATVDEAESGDIIEVPDDIYEESVTVEEELTIAAPDGAILEGVDVEAETGLTITGSSVVIEGLEVRGYDGDGIVVDAEPVTLENVTSRVNGGAGINVDPMFVGEFTLLDSLVSDNAGVGLDCEAGTVTLSGTTVEDNGDAGIEIDTDTLTVTDLTVEDNDDVGLSADAETVTVESVSTNSNDGRAISLAGAEDVSLTDLTSANDEGGVLIDGQDVADRTVDLTDVSVFSSTGGHCGVRITETAVTDDVTVTDCEASGNTNSGFSISAKTVTIDGVTATENEAPDDSTSGEGDGIEVDADTVTIENTTTHTNEGRGIRIQGGSDVTVSGVDSTNDGGAVFVDGEETFDRTVELTDVSALSSTSDSYGVRVSEADDSDDVTVTDCEASNNTNSGFSIDAKTVTFDNVTATGNEEPDGLTSGEGDGIEVAAETVTVTDSQCDGNDTAGLRLDVGTATVEDSVTEDNSTGVIFDEIRDSPPTVGSTSIVDNETGLVNDGDTAAVDAQNNWWGRTDGPVESDDYVGDVLVEPWLESPPDEGKTVEDYIGEDGNAEPGDVFDAIDDWRNDEIGPDIIFEVIDAWRI